MAPALSAGLVNVAALRLDPLHESPTPRDEHIVDTRRVEWLRKQQGEKQTQGATASPEQFGSTSEIGESLRIRTRVVLNPLQDVVLGSYSVP